MRRESGRFYSSLITYHFSLQNGRLCGRLGKCTLCNFQKKKKGEVERGADVVGVAASCTDNLMLARRW